MVFLWNKVILPFVWHNYIQVMEWSETSFTETWKFTLFSACLLITIMKIYISKGRVNRGIHIFIQKLEEEVFSLNLWNANYEMSINSLVTVVLSFEHLLLSFSLAYIYILIYTWFLVSYANTFEQFRSEEETTTCPTALPFLGANLR